MIQIVIPTYQRPDMLKRLLVQLFKQKTKQEFKINIYDDGSQLDNWEVVKSYPVKYIKFEYNHGRVNWWRFVNFIFNQMQEIDFEYYIMLNDDVEVDENFIEETVRVWKGINDERKICLNLLLDKQREGKPCWTGFKPILKGEVWQTQWTDSNFLCTKRFFKSLKYSLREVSHEFLLGKPLRSSGVGKQISERMTAKELHIYQVAKTLVKHDHHISQMNPSERRKNKLTT